MAGQGLCARPERRCKGPAGQNSSHAAPGGLLGRDFSATGADQKWCGGFKEAAASEGPVFLAAVEDLCSRRVVGFAASGDHPAAEPAKAAANTAAAVRGGDAKGVISHSDKGPQHTAGAFAKACRRLGTARSAGRTGNALDNAPAEPFLSTHQHEPIDRRAWAAKAQARHETSLWAHTRHNQRRLHPAIGMVPPIEHEQAHTTDPHKQPLHDQGGSSPRLLLPSSGSPVLSRTLGSGAAMCLCAPRSPVRCSPGSAPTRTWLYGGWPVACTGAGIPRAADVTASPRVMKSGRSSMPGPVRGCRGGPL